VNGIHSEWTKFRTIRSTWWTLTVMAALPTATGVLVAATRSLQPDDTVLAGAIGNAVVGLAPAGILGVLVAAGEHGAGTIRPTITATPRRWPVLLAKAALVAAVVFAVALAANAVGLAVAATMLDDHRSGAAVPPLLGLASLYAAVAILGVAAGLALRSTAGAVTAVTGVLFLPTLLSPLLGSAQWLVDLGPPTAAQQVLQPGGSGGWATVAIVAGYCLAALLPSGWLLLRRDI
jgi:ABC-2 type transport system permease protein